MSESWRTRLERVVFNLYPAYLGTGGRVTHIEADWSEVRVRLPLSWRTRNVVGTIFGGSLYSAVDPFYMMMLMRRLDDSYVVWDKAASIRFHKPAEETLYATFELPDAEVSAVEDELADRDSVDREYEVELVDDEGVVHAVVEKTVHVSTDETKRA
ncbi:DUF4442 domain-containing protein [Halomicroarcula sp. F13]|uniref:DUF4442 domain-containing protein n=1 Tax=Haloarcula rubra TaxID=2487747 RepID=A0AAW4PKM1_9EURY|nr:DUF4442 domain-containing protein [Halomicroarcula rubra]MBX0322073.1 DUF4442 domain-containing protein [Halomicroarcula rubra]